MRPVTFLALSAYAKSRQAVALAAQIATITSALLFPFAARAEPITLKLSFFTSDQSAIYLSTVKPFVDAINRDGANLLHIEVFLSGTLGKTQKELPQLVRSGGADIAFIVPGQTPELFPDTAATELPGLFRDAREATLVYTRLIAAGTLADYKDFIVIGAYGAEPSSIESRKPIASLADLKDQKIRSNNAIMSTALATLGVTPVVIAYNETALAIAKGAIDGAAVDIATMLDVGTSRLTGNHYMLPIGSASLVLLMNRQAFERLPEDAKALIVRYSGDWTAARFIDASLSYKLSAIKLLKGDPRRTYVDPSDTDSEKAQAAFASVRETWASANPRNRDLLTQVGNRTRKTARRQIGPQNAQCNRTFDRSRCIHSATCHPRGADPAQTRVLWTRTGADLPVGHQAVRGWYQCRGTRHSDNPGLFRRSARQSHCRPAAARHRRHGGHRIRHTRSNTLSFPRQRIA